MGGPIAESVVDQDAGNCKAEKNTDAPQHLSPCGLSLADVDQAVEVGGLQELPDGVHGGGLKKN